MTLEQVKAAKPTADYDGRYGATTGPWTTDMFIEAVYKTLPRRLRPPPAGAVQSQLRGVGSDQSARRGSWSRGDCVASRRSRCSRQRGGRGGAPLTGQRRRRARTSPATGCRSSPKTGAGGW